MKKGNDWQIYRTRFLVKAKRLTGPLTFVDALGREHHGHRGDYLVESDGLLRIQPRGIFEDVYTPMEQLGPSDWPAVEQHDSAAGLRRRSAARSLLIT